MCARLVRMTLNREQLTDFVQREAESLSFLNELKIGNLMLAVEAIAATAPGRPGQQARLLIETNGIDTQACPLGDLPYL